MHVQAGSYDRVGRVRVRSLTERTLPPHTTFQVGMDTASPKAVSEVSKCGPD